MSIVVYLEREREREPSRKAKRGSKLSCLSLFFWGGLVWPLEINLETIRR